jgi:hypothetical protein
MFCRIIDCHPSVKGERNTKAEVTMKGWLLKQVRAYFPS